MTSADPTFYPRFAEVVLPAIEATVAEWGELIPFPDHLCFNKLCVRPTHLQLLTRSANAARKRTVLENRCLRGHPKTPENVYEYQGRRYCRTCKYEQERSWKIRSRANRPATPLCGLVLSSGKPCARRASLPGQCGRHAA